MAQGRDMTKVTAPQRRPGKKKKRSFQHLPALRESEGLSETQNSSCGFTQIPPVGEMRQASSPE
jgi:hypothetical protein